MNKTVSIHIVELEQPKAMFLQLTNFFLSLSATSVVPNLQKPVNHCSKIWNCCGPHATPLLLYTQIKMKADLIVHRVHLARHWKFQQLPRVVLSSVLCPLAEHALSHRLPGRAENKQCIPTGNSSVVLRKVLTW